MIGLIFAVLCAAILWAVVARSGLVEHGSAFPRIIMAGFALRVFIQFFVRDVEFFSHALGGDSLGYEASGRLLADLWRHTGVHFVTSAELPDLGPTSLPANLFALIIYLNGGDPSRLGCTAVVALAAALTAVNLYALAVQFGADRRNAVLVSAIFFFQPAFVFYSSDMYKDGLVLVFAIGALGSALRLSSRFSLLHAFIGLACVLALWYVRFYLIFVAFAPLVVGIVGIGSKNSNRPLFAALTIVVVMLVLSGFTDILQLASERASDTFDVATSRAVLKSNREGGSGVIFDDGGSPYGALPVKLLYTVLAPFPWSAGSIGFQLGKFDALLWYFMLYRAVRGIRTVDRRLLLMLATFVVPCTFMYAMTMANVGLIIRQRLVIVAAVAILAALYKPEKRPQAVPRNSRIAAARRRSRRGAAAKAFVP